MANLPLNNTDDPELRQRVDNFLSQEKGIVDKDEFIEKFGELGPVIQEECIRRLMYYPLFASQKFVEFLPYKEYEAIYNKVIRSDPSSHITLVESIAEFYSDEALELLAFVFQNAKDLRACENAASGLVKSSFGLSALETALKSGDVLQKISAAKTLARCKQLSTEQLKALLSDEDENVRSVTMHLVRKIDVEIAKDFVLLLEDKKSYIVDGVFDILKDARSLFLNEEIVANAIINELIIRDAERPSEYFTREKVVNVLLMLFERSPRLRGQTLNTLCEIAFKNDGAIRRRAALVAIDIDKQGFLAHVSENATLQPRASNGQSE